VAVLIEIVTFTLQCNKYITKNNKVCRTYREFKLLEDAVFKNPGGAEGQLDRISTLTDELLQFRADDLQQLYLASFQNYFLQTK